MRGHVRGVAGREALDGGVVKVGGEGPRPVDAVLVDDVSDETSHRNADVLDLGMAEEADRFGVSRAPKIQTG